MRAIPFLIGALAALALSTAAASAQSATASETLAVDASDVARGIVHARLELPAQPGAFTVVYPRWLPGEHSPAGPIADLVSLRFAAGGRALPWRRDPVDLYAFHVQVPAGTTRIEAGLDYLLAAGPPLSSKERVSTARLAILNWYAFALYPQGSVNSALQVVPSIVLPPGWDYATALSTRRRSGNQVAFAPATLERVFDSPLLTGRDFRRYVLDRAASGSAELDLAADVPEDLDVPAGVLTGYARLVREADAEYGARHWRDYHFLVTASDLIEFNGIEHHESSDNRVGAGTLRDPELFDAAADLLPHEFSHSWNGKYRRPYDLQVSNYQDPERTDLLWVYEGLTQYLGHVLASRAGLRAPAEFADVIATAAASLDDTPGRGWRPLADTAVSAPFLYFATRQFERIRRATDYYDEGMLMWLEADSIIRERSGGSKSLDDFVRAFYGPPASGPQVVTYTRADVVAALAAVQPYDWEGFFRDRIDAITPHPPFAGFERDGWRLVYSATPSAYAKSLEKGIKQIDATYSLGLLVASDSGEITDVLPGSPAARAGLAPFGKLLAIGGRRWSADAFHAAIAATASRPADLPVVVDQLGEVTTVTVRYGGGERYPHLERIPGRTDLLARVVTPRAQVAAGVPSPGARLPSVLTSLGDLQWRKQRPRAVRRSSTGRA